VKNYLRLWCAVLILALGLGAGSAFGLTVDEAKFPRGWELTQVIVLPADQLPVMSKKLRGEVIDLKNYIINAKGINLQVNIVECKNEAHAESVYDSLVEIRGSDEFVQMHGESVVEYVCNDIDVVVQARKIF